MPGFSLIWPITPASDDCVTSVVAALWVALSCDSFWDFVSFWCILGSILWDGLLLKFVGCYFSWINWSHQFGWRRLQRQRHFCHILPRACVAAMVLTVNADGQTAWWTSPSLLPLSTAGCVEGTLQPAPEQLGVSFLLFEGWTSETTWVSFAQDTYFSSPLWAFVWIHGCLFYPLDSNPVSFYF